MNTKEANKHIAMILEPFEWPRWPVLPMKNPDNTPNHGVILAVEGYYSQDGSCPIYVWHTNLFMIPTKVTKKGVSVIDFSMLGDRHDIYPDAEAVVDAGWQVD